MRFSKLEIRYLLLLLIFMMVKGGSLPWPDFESGWLPIINGLEHVARLNIDHGLVEIPVLVDVSVKIKGKIFPASGFRPDHPKEKSGPVVYIYDDAYVNVSTSPIDDPLYRIIPQVPGPWRYDHANLVIMGDVQVRIRAWTQSSLPTENFKQTGIMLKANTSKVSDSYAEIHHNLGEIPCLVVVRIKMHHNNDTIMADGVGSCMQVFAGVPDRTNAYLVYGYSNTTFRLWVDSSSNGAIFDGRKHTWFDMVISEGKAEIFAWKCSTLTPRCNQRVVTRNSMGYLPTRGRIEANYDLQASLVRVSVQAEDPGGANEGFRFPGAMYLGYPTTDSGKQPAFGGLSYTYEMDGEFDFWQPKYSDNKSTIFIAESFGAGKNAEISSSESVYIQTWIYEENGGCPTPVIPNGGADTSVNGTSTAAQANAFCNEGFVFKPKYAVYRYDHEQFTITCHEFGYWENMPSCLPKDKEVDSECSPALKNCRDKHATCTLVPVNNVYKCTCNNGYIHVDGRCKAQGQYLPKADYDSDWLWINWQGSNWHLELEHGLDTVPILVDVQVKSENYVFHAIGFPSDQDEKGLDSSAVVYIYDGRHINVSSCQDAKNSDNRLRIRSDIWYGYQFGWSGYIKVRARAWQLVSLPSPDVLDDTRVLRANTNIASDSFYELKHNLGEYPGLVVVRAKMMQDGSTFYADGVGSALNVFHNKPDMTNAFLVYGFSNESVRTWVDSSVNGAIFDGRKLTNFDIVISEATVEIYAWKISTLTPFYTYTFSLEDGRFPSYVELPMDYALSDALNVAVADVRDPTSRNQNFRFPSSSYLASRSPYRDAADNARDCIFGGFTFVYESDLRTLVFSREAGSKMLLYKPIHISGPNYDTGALVCIPDSFGDGQYSEAVFNGIGIMHSWINGDCGSPPEVDNGYINTTESGTEVGATAVLVCDGGYRHSNDFIPVCHQTIEWRVFTSCRPVECNNVEALVNGSMNVSGLTYGNNVTFQCDVGYKLAGTEMIECLSSGTWSASIPSCRLPDDKKTSRSVRGQGNVVIILLTITLSTFVFIERL